MGARLAELTICRASVPGVSGGRSRSRAVLARSLDHAGAASLGGPPSEILLVREVRIASRAAPDEAGFDGGSAVRSRLKELRRVAMRPRKGRVPSSAEAVLFRDESELLASLMLAGPMPPGTEPWWWRCAARLVPALRRPRGIASALAERAMLLPGVVAILDRWGLAEKVISALRHDEVAMIAGAVCNAWRIAPSPAGEPAPGAADAAFPGIGAVNGRPGEILDSALDRTPLTQMVALLAAGRILGRVPPGRWHVISDATAPLLSRAMGLVETPSKRRSDWLEVETESRGRSSVRAASQVPLELRSEVLHLPRDHRRPLDNAIAGYERRGLAETPSAENDPPNPTAISETMTTTPGAASTDGDSRTRSAGAPTTREAPPVADTPDEPVGELPGHHDGARPGEVRTGLAAAPARVVTELAGVFFLWRLITALDLPAAAADWRMETSLGGWGLLESVARAVLAAGEGPWRDDPVWPLLASLDGRCPCEPCGDGMVEPDDVRMPAAWELPEEGRLFWHHDGTQLVVWMPGDILLLRTPCALDERASCLRRETGRLGLAPGGAVECATPPAFPPPAAAREWTPAPALSAWLALFGAALLGRLNAALGASTSESLAQLGRRAEVHVSPSHVDVVSRLDQATLPVRRAGLDVDPGWVPALGHVVSFHYQ